jgi:hypothetical protein
VTDIDIDKLEALERAATPAPWVYDDGIEQDEHTQHRARPETVGPFGADAARTDDCIFLAVLRNAAPALLAEVRRLRAIEAAAREVAANVEDDSDSLLGCVVVQPSREEWSAFKAALAAKDML